MINKSQIKLSTEGKLNLPSLFEIKDFSVQQIYNLSKVDKGEITSLLIQYLNENTDEKIDFNKSTFGELIEILVKFYIAFYGTKISVNYTPSKNDIEFLKKNVKDDVISDLKSGKWKPRVDVDLTKLTQFKNTNLKQNFTYTRDNLKVNCRIPLIEDYIKADLLTNRKHTDDDMFKLIDRCIDKKDIEVLDKINIWHNLKNITDKIGLKDEYEFINPITGEKEGNGANNLNFFHSQIFYILLSIQQLRFSQFINYTFE